MATTTTKGTGKGGIKHERDEGEEEEEETFDDPWSRTGARINPDVWLRFRSTAAARGKHMVLGDPEYPIRLTLDEARALSRGQEPSPRLLSSRRLVMLEIDPGQGIIREPYLLIMEEYHNANLDKWLPCGYSKPVKLTKDDQKRLRDVVP